MRATADPIITIRPDRNSAARREAAARLVTLDAELRRARDLADQYQADPFLATVWRETANRLEARIAELER